MNPSTLKRLGFIKYLATLGITQSKMPEPLNAASVLFLHDAVELFLQLATEVLNVGKSEPNFMDYWDLISPKLSPEVLPQKESMRRLNKSRVALKHHGTHPSKLDIEAFRSAAIDFFEQATPLVFTAQFAEVSLGLVLK